METKKENLKNFVKETNILIDEVAKYRNNDVKKHEPKNNVVKNKVSKLNSTEVIVNEILNKIIDDIEFQKERNNDPEIAEKSLQHKTHSGINTKLSHVVNYLDRIIGKAMENPEEFINDLSVPLNYNPLFTLGKIQNEGYDYYSDLDISISQPVLPIEIYMQIDNNENNIKESTLQDYIDIHNRCIFDAMNSALDFYRPYELNGPPLPWSKATRELTYKNGSVEIAKEILSGAKARVLIYAMSKISLIKKPEEFDISGIYTLLKNDNKKVNRHRDKKITKVLGNEVVYYIN